MRPLVCREHLVTTNPSACNFTSPAIPTTVELPISVASTLMKTSDQLDNSTQEAIILPFTVVWAEENEERSKRIWPAETLARTFVETIQAATYAEKSDTPNSLPIIEQPQCPTQPSLEYAENNY